MSLDIQLQVYAKPITHRYRLIKKIIFRRAGKEAFILGEDFEVIYSITNISGKPFPNSVLEVDIHWPNGQSEQSPYQISPLNPGESHDISARWGVLTTGFALFFVKLHQGAMLSQTPREYSISYSGSPDSSNLFRDSEKQNRIPENASFFSVFGQSKEEFYEFWAMMASALSLVYLVLFDALPKIINILKNFLSFLMQFKV